MPLDELPAGWESSWEHLIGSPRFEEARQSCGCLVEDLKPMAMPSQKNLETQVVQQLAQRREKRRLYELRNVMLERKRLVDIADAAKAGDAPTDWAAKMKAENEARIALLKEQAIRANEVQQRRTCFELAKSLAVETRAQQMVEEAREREAKLKQREEERTLEIKKQQQERKEKRIQMEHAKALELQKQEEDMVKKLYEYKLAEEMREEINRRKNEERTMVAKRREVERLRAQEEHQRIATAQLEDYREQTLRQFESKEARHLQWQLNEARRHAELLRESRQSESGVGKRLSEALGKQADHQLREAEKAMSKRRMAEERFQRQEYEKTEAMAVKRQLAIARHQRQHSLLKSIREGEEDHTLVIKERLYAQDRVLHEQRRQMAQSHEHKKILAAARENEKLRMVERTRRAQEHMLNKQVARHMEMEGRASGLQNERRALIEERARSAKMLALQRAAVQEQFKRARSVGDLKKSKTMLAEIGVDLDSIKQLSETMLSSTSIAGRHATSVATSVEHPLSIYIPRPIEHAGSRAGSSVSVGAGASSLSVGGRPSTAPQNGSPPPTSEPKVASDTAPAAAPEMAAASLADPPPMA